jgi:hypothetical protein
VASGLINTSRQIGGAIGLAAASAVATTATNHYVSAHGVAASSGPALDHGLQTGLYVLLGLLVVGALAAVSLVRSAPGPRPVEERFGAEPVPVEEAA